MKKILWVMVSCIMVLSLVIASCGSEEVKKEEEEAEADEQQTVTLKLEKEDGTVIEKKVDKPQYGGTLTWALSSDIQGFDDAFRINVACTANSLTCEEPLTGDYTKGPSGTGEYPFLRGSETTFYPYPLLAESWEWPDETTIVLNMRKGVHFANNPDSEASQLVGGREVNAEDVVFSLLRMWNQPTSPQAMFCPYDMAVESITAPDEWTVVVKTKPGMFSRVWMRAGDCIFVIPHEVIDKYGDMQDWQNNVGTGPYILTDFIPGSTATFVRNPDYWRKHPLFPEDTMPYPDGAKMLIMPDASSRQAALRTGAIDGVGKEQFPYDMWQSLKSTAPQLVYREYMAETTATIYMRVDEGIFTDLRIRRALSMAIDRETIKHKYYDGKAEIYSYPILPELKQWYIPIEDYPESAQELFEYHPDKAEQLLTEAGYPDGFETEIVCTSGNVDLLSIVVADWEKIGVKAELQVLEMGIYRSMMMGQKRTYSGCAYSDTMTEAPNELYVWQSGMPANAGNIKDDVIDQAFLGISAAYFDKEEQARLIKEVYPYIVDQSYIIPIAAPLVYMAWQPWLKGYNGERAIGLWNGADYYLYSWLDQDMKKSMGH
ncbi:MAG: ABC transporter substrate-binding protein [Dehalococcoidales bacterium]|nr:ABC transporter substrate-binding protein [Dehalococcoidales bacterium]